MNDEENENLIVKDATSDSDIDEQGFSAATSDDVPNKDRKGKLIFVCDDDLSILEVIKIMLEEEGYTVETFEDGQHLVERLDEEIPDLILLDYWMAKQDGKQTIIEIKESEKAKNIKIILISAINNIEDVAKNLNIDNFLEKPFEMDTLISKVNGLISQ